MSVENNRKYIAEAWIDNGEDEEFKTSFLESLLSQIQGHEKGFDADTVDGKHYTGILEEIREATQNFVERFQIGNTTFESGHNAFQYYLGFEAIKLYNPDAEGTEDENKKLPWSSVIYTEETGIPDLLTVINKLYELVYMGDPEKFNNSGEHISNREIYNNFITRIDELERKFDIIDEKIDGNGLLDADSVNGVRFFIKTREQYEDIKDKADEFERKKDSDYESVKDLEPYYNLIHHVNNIFIIKTKAEIEESGYTDGVFKGPDTAPIVTKYYRFRIDDALEEGHTGKYLQYSHDDGTEWYDMCPTDRFIDEEVLEDKIVDVFNNNSNYVLNTNVLADSLSRLNISDETNFPILSYGRNKFLTGCIYDYVNDSDHETIPNKKIGKFTYSNLTDLVNLLRDGTESVRSELNDYKNEVSGDNGDLQEIRGDLAGFNNSLSAVKGGSTKSIQDCFNKLDSIESTLNNLLTNFSDFGWNKIQNFNEWNNSTMNLDEHLKVYVNKGLGLGYIKVDEFKADKDGEWKTIGRIPIKNFQPVWTTHIPSHNFNCKIRIIEDDHGADSGKVQYYSKMGASLTNKKSVDGDGFFVIKVENERE